MYFEYSGNDESLLVEQRAPRPAGVRALVPDNTPLPLTKPTHDSHRRSRQLFITNISRRAVVLVVPSDTASGKRGCLLL
jgi:hypothetical protein